MEEKWKYIPGFEGLYQVSSNGRIKSVKRKVKYIKRNKEWGMKWHPEKILKTDRRLATGGYETVILNDRKTYTIHRLVAKTFIPNPLNHPVVNHLDGKKRNNSVTNLEWTTVSGNHLHAYAIGLKNDLLHKLSERWRGNKNPKYKHGKRVTPI